MKPKSEPVPETGEMDPDSGHAHACTAADVEVDTETGEVRVLRLISSYEIGRAINPNMARQQIIGGAWMGISHALFETTAPYYPSQEHAPGDFNEYLMPGFGELTEVDGAILQRPSTSGPFGAKGLGEMTANPPIGAIANAIFNATGVRIKHLPITPEQVLRGIEELQMNPDRLSD